MICDMFAADIKTYESHRFEGTARVAGEVKFLEEQSYEAS